MSCLARGTEELGEPSHSLLPFTPTLEVTRWVGKSHQPWKLHVEVEKSQGKSCLIYLGPWRGPGAQQAPCLRWTSHEYALNRPVCQCSEDTFPQPCGLIAPCTGVLFDVVGVFSNRKPQQMQWHSDSHNTAVSRQLTATKHTTVLAVPVRGSIALSVSGASRVT